MTVAIRDKFNFIFWLVIIGLSSLFVLYILIIRIEEIISTGFFFKHFLSLAVAIIIFFLVIQTFVRSTSIWYISKEKRKITFKNYFTRRRTEYHFDNLDGYVTGRFIEKGGPFKIIWIVKNNKIIQRIDERYILNYNELEEELKEIKYLGYQSKIGLFKRFQMIFGSISIDKKSTPSKGVH